MLREYRSLKRVTWPMKGSYVLLIELPEEQTITIGSLKAVHFSRGYYAYVGSAMSGFKSRLSHHLQPKKRPHWHIDYLLSEASISSIVLCPTKQRTECTIAQALRSQLDYIPGFGASDCPCSSHLFYATDRAGLKSSIMAAIELLATSP